MVKCFDNGGKSKKKRPAQHAGLFFFTFSARTYKSGPSRRRLRWR